MSALTTTLFAVGTEATAARRTLSAASTTQYDFGNSFGGGGWLDRRRLSLSMQNARPRIERRHAGSNELAGVARDDDQILQRGNGGDEQDRPSEGVAALLSFYDDAKADVDTLTAATARAGFPSAPKN